MDYFQNLFVASITQNEERALSVISQCINVGMNEELMKEFNKEEIEVVSKSVAPLKSFW